MKTVLVIDDHPASRDYVTFLLEHTGHRVIGAEDGCRGLELARQERPALIISDILMPTMDGIELARRLHADPALARIPLIFYTATYRQREAERVAESVGADRVLLKPADPDVILAAVAQLLGTAPQKLAPGADDARAAGAHEQLVERLARATSALDLTSQRLALLIDAGRQFTEQSEPARVGQLLARAARSMVSARYAVVCFASDRSSDALTCALAGIPHDASIALPDRLPRTGRLARLFSGAPTLRAELASTHEAGLPANHPPVTHLMAARIGPVDHPVGLVYCVDKVGGGPFEAAEEVLVATLADQAGTIFENVRLYRELAQELADRRATEHRLAIQYEITRLLAEPLTRSDAIARVLATLGTRLGWAFAAYWSYDVPERRLACRSTWSAPGHDVSALERASRALRPGPGQGIAAEVWRTGKPVGVDEYPDREDVLRASEARAAGLHAACAFPVVSSTGPEGIVELFSRDKVPLDAPMLEMMAALGALIGQFLERRRAQDELEESEERHRLLAALTSDFTHSWLVEPDGRLHLQWLSPSFTKIFGYARDEVDGDGWTQMVHPEDLPRTKHELARVLEGHDADYEVRLVSRHGKVHELRTVMRPVRDADGRVVRFYGAVQDLTRHRQLEEQLRQSQKMEAVGRLAGGVAHDFNNMLTVISGYAGMVLERMPADDASRADVIEIATAGDRASALTRQLLAFSRRSVFQMRVVEMNSVVSEMDRMLQRLIGENIELVTHLDPAAGLVRVDATAIEQVLMNLVVNARDAMPDGGTLTIETAPETLDAHYAATHPDAKPGAYAMLAITDTGCGMDRDTQNRIFEPFFTTKKKGEGTGLGLSTVYGIVQQSGGHIRVYSEPGHGSTFRIYLPREGGIADERVQAQPRAPRAQASETILVVEDEPSVRRLAVKVLREAGYTVLEADSPNAALEACAQADVRIDLMVTDVVMPTLSGPELLERVRALRPHVRALFVSGYTASAIERQGVLRPRTPFLAKPFTPATLARRVREVLDEV